MGNLNSVFSLILMLRTSLSISASPRGRAVAKMQPTGGVKSMDSEERLTGSVIYCGREDLQ